MLVRLAPSVFADPSLSIAIISLLGLSKAGRIYIAVEDDEALAYTDWLAKQNKETLDEWRVALDWSELDQAAFQIQSVLVSSRQDDDWKADPPQLTVQSAVRLSARTFDILVENQRNDRAFLLAFAGDSKAVLERLEQSNAIRFAGSGGIGELKAVIRDQVSRQQERRLKNFALFDSDGEAPGHVSTAAKAVLDEAAEHEVPSHCLERRAIENYLPLPAVFDFVGGRSSRDQRRALQKVAEAFKGLTEEQKNHFPMKVGLPAAPTPRQQLLYQGLGSEQRASLGSGFTDSLSEMYGVSHEPKLSGQIEMDDAKDEVRRAVRAILFYVRAPA